MASCPVKSKNPIICGYCQCKSNDLLIKCIDANCNRWFCNSDLVKGAVGSHIYLHLNKSNHKVIELHRNRHCKIGKIECKICKEDKVFSLGMHVYSHELYCRQCSIDRKISVDEWKNLIQERQFDNDLINYK